MPLLDETHEIIPLPAPLSSSALRADRFRIDRATRAIRQELHGLSLRAVVPAPDFWRVTPVPVLARDTPSVLAEVALEGLSGAGTICGVLAASPTGAPARSGANLPEKRSAKPASKRMMLGSKLGKFGTRSAAFNKANVNQMLRSQQGLQQTSLTPDSGDDKCGTIVHATRSTPVVRDPCTVHLLVADILWRQPGRDGLGGLRISNDLFWVHDMPGIEHGARTA